MIELFQNIAENNYTVVYLTARSMAQDVATRKYLFEVSALGCSTDKLDICGAASQLRIGRSYKQKIQLKMFHFTLLIHFKVIRLVKHLKNSQSESLKMTKALIYYENFFIVSVPR